MNLVSIFVFLGGLGTGEMIFIGLILLLFFGAKKIPDMMKGLGQGVKEFKNATKDVKENIEKSMEDTSSNN